jgi:DNA-binding MarR family transcriptional regulator
MGLVEDLAAAFVAFVIEVDDAAEARRPAGKRPWLVSVVMWRNCLQWVPRAGIAVVELVEAARTWTDFHGMRRWGYLEVSGWPRTASGRPRLEAVVRPTGHGARAQKVWEGLPAEVEGRWAERDASAANGGAGGQEGGLSGTGHGDGVGELRAALVALAEELDPGLPDTMPIVRHGWATRRDDEPERQAGPVKIADLGIDSLLARPLTAFALEYEGSGKLSLAMSANLLAVLGGEPIPLRDLPDATGIYRAQIDNAVGYLERASLAEVVPTPGAKRGKSVLLTSRGEKAKASSVAKLAALEATWDERHGATLARVREALGPFTAGPASPPPGTWRAEAKPLARLPRFPLVTHRGGFPDGA